MTLVNEVNALTRFRRLTEKQLEEQAKENITTVVALLEQDRVVIKDAEAHELVRNMITYGIKDW